MVILDNISTILDRSYGITVIEEKAEEHYNTPLEINDETTDETSEPQQRRSVPE